MQLDEAMADTDVDRYFVNEIEAMQRVTSPYVANIAPGHWGVLRGHGWILMEFFPNGPLRMLILQVVLCVHYHTCATA
jgi:hypothetical protein